MNLIKLHTACGYDYALTSDQDSVASVSQARTHQKSSASQAILKSPLTILLSCALLCSCSQKQASSSGSAIDLVKDQRAIEWSNGHVLYIGKRRGDSLQDIQISYQYPNGQTVRICATKGSVSAGSVQDGNDKNSVRIVLQDARIVRGAQFWTSNELTLVFQKAP